MSKEAMKLALEALETIAGAMPFPVGKSAITALREALAEQPAQQGPVAHCEGGPDVCPVCRAETRSLALAAAVGYIQRNTPPLVSTEICNALKKSTTPAQRKPLTDEEIDTLREANSEGRGAGWRFNFKGFARAIEAKLKEKNNG